MTTPPVGPARAPRRSRSRRAPWYPRLLRLQILVLSPRRRAVLADGTLVLAVLLGLAEAAGAWIVFWLPAAVAVAVVLNDRVAVALWRPAPPPELPGVDPRRAAVAFGRLERALRRAVARGEGLLPPLDLDGLDPAGRPPVGSAGPGRLVATEVAGSDHDGQFDVYAAGRVHRVAWRLGPEGFRWTRVRRTEGPRPTPSGVR